MGRANNTLQRSEKNEWINECTYQCRWKCISHIVPLPWKRHKSHRTKRYFSCWINSVAKRLLNVRQVYCQHHRCHCRTDMNAAMLRVFKRGCSNHSNFMITTHKCTRNGFFCLVSEHLFFGQQIYSGILRLICEWLEKLNDLLALWVSTAWSRRREKERES